MLTITTTARLHHATRAKAERLDAILTAEYPALALAPAYNEDESQVVGWVVVHGGEEAIYEGKQVPELADLLEACEDAGLDPEEGVDTDDEDESPRGSVVPEEYRAQYREVSSNGQTCGDWLAEFLVLHTHGIDGFMVDDFSAILNNNGVDMSAKWAQLPFSGQRGWVGRYRMNGRQSLEKLVALRGKVAGVTGIWYDVPAADLAILQRKHAKWIEKQLKAAAKAAQTEAA